MKHLQERYVEDHVLIEQMEQSKRITKHMLDNDVRPFNGRYYKNFFRALLQLSDIFVMPMQKGKKEVSIPSFSGHYVKLDADYNDIYSAKKEGKIYYLLQQIYVPAKLRGGGFGTRIMISLCTIADVYEWNIILWAQSPYENYSTALVEWYRQFGFIQPDGTNMLMREFK